MDRYTCAGVLADLDDGQPVLVATPDLPAALDEYAALLEYLDDQNGGDGPPGWVTGGVSPGSCYWLRDTIAGASVTFAPHNSPVLEHLDARVLVVVGHAAMPAGTLDRLARFTTWTDPVILQ